MRKAMGGASLPAGRAGVQGPHAQFEISVQYPVEMPGRQLQLVGLESGTEVWAGSKHLGIISM